MTAKELLLAMEEVEDRFLLQADVFGEATAPVNVLRGFFKWAGAVAAVLIVGAGLWFMGSLGLLDPVDSGSHSIAAGHGSRSSQAASSEGRPASSQVLEDTGVPRLTFPSEEELEGWTPQGTGWQDREFRTRVELSEEQIARLWGQERLTFEGKALPDGVALTGVAYFDENGLARRVLLVVLADPTNLTQCFLQIRLDRGDGGELFQVYGPNAPHVCTVHGTAVATLARRLPEETDDGASVYTAEFCREGEPDTAVSVLAFDRWTPDAETVLDLLDRVVSQSTRPETPFSIGALDRPPAQSGAASPTPEPSPSVSSPAGGIQLTPAEGEDAGERRIYQSIGDGLFIIAGGEESRPSEEELLEALEAERQALEERRAREESRAEEEGGSPATEPAPLDLTDGELRLVRNAVFSELGFYLNYFSNDGRYPVTERSIRRVRITYFRPERGTDHPYRSYYGELEVRFKPRAGDEEHWISWLGDTVRGTGEDQGYLVARRGFVYDDYGSVYGGSLNPGNIRRPNSPEILESLGYQPIEPLPLGDMLTLPALRAIMKSPDGLTAEALEPYGYSGLNKMRSYLLPEGYDLDVWVENGKLTKTEFYDGSDRRLIIDLLTNDLEAYLLLVGDN